MEELSVQEILELLEECARLSQALVKAKQSACERRVGVDMYRPKGWENPYTYKDLVARPKSDVIDTTNLPEMTAFEAGADAMLEVLSKLPCAALLYIITEHNTLFIHRMPIPINV